MADKSRIFPSRREKQPQLWASQASYVVSLRQRYGRVATTKEAELLCHAELTTPVTAILLP